MGGSPKFSTELDRWEGVGLSRRTTRGSAYALEGVPGDGSRRLRGYMKSRDYVSRETETVETVVRFFTSWNS